MSEDASHELQTVGFAIGREEYGIDISKVQEIIRLPEITKLPNTPDNVLGIANLRGSIIPVIDLKKKFINSESERGAESRVVVVEAGSKKAGLVVDQVSEVRKISRSSIVTAGSIGTNIEADYLFGVVRLEQRLLIMLCVDKIL